MFLKVLLLLACINGSEGFFSYIDWEAVGGAVWDLVTQINPLKTDKVCYGDLGCFGNSGSFFDLSNRPIQMLPQEPEWINTKFFLHTRRAPVQEIELTTDFKFTSFSPDRQTKLIVHGFASNAKEQWLIDMKDALLGEGDFNVILVDWSRGATPPYTQATANTRVVGAQIAILIDELTAHGCSAADFHIIGHSLGAHISGYAGERTEGLGRISGLDPAQPYFENTHTDVRLDPSDALFVDVIHTDADDLLEVALSGQGGFGTNQISGHVDFFPNGGFNQPGCVVTVEGGLLGVIGEAPELLAYDHGRANELYIESIKSKSCRFTAVPCPSYAAFKQGKCASCGEVGCSRMGYFADTAKPEVGDELVAHYLDTSAEKPFCLHHYFGSLTVDQSQDPVVGNMSVQIHGKDDASTTMSRLNDSSVSYNASEEHGFVVTSPLLIPEIQSLTFGWETTNDAETLAIEDVVVSTVTDEFSETRTEFVMKESLVSGKTSQADSAASGS